MNRRSFIRLIPGLAALPFVKRWVEREEPTVTPFEPTGKFFTTPNWKMRRGNETLMVGMNPATCPLCEKALDEFGELNWGQPSDMLGVNMNPSSYTRFICLLLTIAKNHSERAAEPTIHPELNDAYFAVDVSVAIDILYESYPNQKSFKHVCATALQNMRDLTDNIIREREGEEGVQRHREAVERSKKAMDKWFEEREMKTLVDDSLKEFRQLLDEDDGEAWKNQG